MVQGRNRESRSREAAGRRNEPEAVPRKMRGMERGHAGLNASATGACFDPKRRTAQRRHGTRYRQTIHRLWGAL